MSGHLVLSKLRAYIEEIRPDLLPALNSLWDISLTLHNDQNEPNGTENGRIHVTKVEENIWRLIDESPGIRITHFQGEELFVLSAAACCHDFDKALTRYDPASYPHPFVHGSGSAHFVATNCSELGLVGREDLAQRISEVCQIHALKGTAFEQALEELKVDEVTSGAPINVYKLAVMLKAADILHTDKSRTHTVGFKPGTLVGVNKSKYLARNRIEGWKINGTDIIIEGTYQKPEQHRALKACKEYMEGTEWPCVGKFLKPLNFPYKLSLNITRKPKGVIMVPDQSFIRIDRWRNFEISLTNAVLGVTTKFRQESICHNQYASHAVGSALSLLAARSCRDKIGCLKSAFESFTDLCWEEDFSYDKLTEHIIFLSDLSSCLKQLLDEPARRLGEVGDAGYRQKNRYNILNTILHMLPDAKEIIEVNMPAIRDELTTEINKLNDTLVRVARQINVLPSRERPKARKDKTRYPAIKRTMKAFFPALTNMKNTVGELANKFDSIVDKIGEDWNNDISDLRAVDATCSAS